MSEETKQPVEETPEVQTEPKEDAPQTEEAEQPAEKTAKGKKKKEKGYTFTREQVEQMELIAKQLESVKDQFVRQTAEYENYRKRTTKEKENIYQDAKADTAKKFLPVYDNLERALAQETADEAYKKGVEMTMNQLVKVMEGLGVTSFGEIGEVFDPARHNAVMHVEQEGLGENVIAEVFQKGFLVGEKVIRFAMVKVAN